MIIDENIRTDQTPLLKRLLMVMIATQGDEKSGYFKVSKDYSGIYKPEGIYFRLNLQSNIHPSQYDELSWRELWKELYGVCNL